MVPCVPPDNRLNNIYPGEVIKEKSIYSCKLPGGTDCTVAQRPWKAVSGVLLRVPD